MSKEKPPTNYEDGESGLMLDLSYWLARKVPEGLVEEMEGLEPDKEIVRVTRDLTQVERAWLEMESEFVDNGEKRFGYSWKLSFIAKFALDPKSSEQSLSIVLDRDDGLRVALQQGKYKDHFKKTHQNDARRAFSSGRASKASKPVLNARLEVGKGVFNITRASGGGFVLESTDSLNGVNLVREGTQLKVLGEMDAILNLGSYLIHRVVNQLTGEERQVWESGDGY